MTAAKKSKALPITLLTIGALLGALAIAELVLRLLPQRGPLGQLSYETKDGKPVADLTEAAKLGFVVPVDPAVRPRARYQFAPGLEFYLRYSDNDRLHRDWLDEQGRVAVRINRFGLRERDLIEPTKPAGQRRIVCLGDSFTFGWGVREEDCWVRLLENELRAAGQDVRTVNCGAAGTVCVDEYWWGLQHRFARFAPDAVIVTICLNDLIPCSGLFVQGPTANTGWRIADLAMRACQRDPLDLDPKVDWVNLLLNLPQQAGEDGGLYGENNPFEALWAQGGPQRALAAMHAWCQERKLPLMVVLWPFLQGLGPSRTYPFTKLHQLVADECRRIGIAFLDVLPVLCSTSAEDLWVTPADMHANPTAQRLVLPPISAFVKQHGRF